VRGGSASEQSGLERDMLVCYFMDQCYQKRVAVGVGIDGNIMLTVFKTVVA